MAKFGITLSVLFFGLPFSAQAKANDCVIGKLSKTVERESFDPNDFLDVNRFKKISESRRKSGQPEPMVMLPSFEAARNYVLRFPALHKRGLGEKTYRWQKVYGRLEKSSTFGKFIGWEEKLDNGDFARFRYDYDPEHGPHWNIEIAMHEIDGSRHTYKLAVGFLCSGQNCSEELAHAYLEQMNR